MRCSTAERFLSRKLDQELKPRQSLALNLHLSGCPSCRQIDLHNQAIKQTIQQDKPAEFPQWLHHRIMHNLPQSQRPSLAQRWKLSYASAAVAVIFSLYAGTWVGIQSFALRADTSQTLSTEDNNHGSFGQISLLEAYDE